MASLCTALNLSNEQHCAKPATSSNGLFCTFHAHQCYGLYRGYKRRNAQLDKLSANPPMYFVNSSTPLANDSFANVQTEALCSQIHEHLFSEFQLIDRVIRARRLHNSRFYRSYLFQQFLSRNNEFPTPT